MLKILDSYHVTTTVEIQLIIYDSITFSVLNRNRSRILPAKKRSNFVMKWYEEFASFTEWTPKQVTDFQATEQVYNQPFDRVLL